MTEPATSVADAVQIVISNLQATDCETIALAHATGRVLCTDVAAEFDIPPWTNAAMDGYACRGDDIQSATGEAPVVLSVVETIAAGSFASRDLRPSEAMRIMTGAPVPGGADTVVRVEDTDGGTETVRILRSRDAHANLRSRGEDLRTGETALHAGTTLGPGAIGMLAAIGLASTAVHRQPRVAIISSGDELVSPEDLRSARNGARIASANNYSLSALVREAGGQPVDLGIVPDNLGALRDAVNRATDCDLIVTSGGISVGAFDHTRDAVAALGAEVRFWRVPMRPGYNSAFGFIRDTPWIGVPGNPVSAIVAAEILVWPAIRRLSGATSPFRRTIPVAAAEPLKGSKDATVLLRAVLEKDGETVLARLTGPQGSAILSSCARADALLIIPAGRVGVRPGESVDALLLRSESTEPVLSAYAPSASASSSRAFTSTPQR
jgi:molybdopterin molybdotransferase